MGTALMESVAAIKAHVQFEGPLQPTRASRVSAFVHTVEPYVREAEGMHKGLEEAARSHPTDWVRRGAQASAHQLEREARFGPAFGIASEAVIQWVEDESGA
jgi:hypothetical protein